MATDFAIPINNVIAVIGAGGYTAGSETLDVAAGQGANFTVLGANQFYRITVVQKDYAYSPAITSSNYTIYRANGRNVDQFTGVSYISGSNSNNYVADDVVDVRVTAETIGELQTAINLHDALSPLANSSVAISTTTVLSDSAFGKNHVCSGTAGNYTVTLPAVAGNEGKFIWIMMSPALTKLVTIDGNGSELIDGSLTRVMWKNETACLYCDGTGWVKVAGKSIPMSCTMYRSAALNVSGGGGVVSVPFDATSVDSTGLMASIPSNRISIVRPSTYMISGVLYLAMSGIGSTSYVLGFLFKNVTLTILANANAAAAGSAQPLILSGAFACVSGDTWTMAGQQGSGQDAAVQTGSTSTFLSLNEIVEW